MSDNRLLGTWRLVSLQTHLANGQVQSEAATGLLTYTPDGYVFAAVAYGPQPRFASDKLFEGTAEEYTTVGRRSLSYGGRYTVEGTQAVHYVEMSSFPNWIGATFTR